MVQLIDIQCSQLNLADNIVNCMSDELDLQDIGSRNNISVATKSMKNHNKTIVKEFDEEKKEEAKARFTQKLEQCQKFFHCIIKLKKDLASNSIFMAKFTFYLEVGSLIPVIIICYHMVVR